MQPAVALAPLSQSWRNVSRWPSTIPVTNTSSATRPEATRNLDGGSSKSSGTGRPAGSLSHGILCHPEDRRHTGSSSQSNRRYARFHRHLHRFASQCSSFAASGRLHVCTRSWGEKPIETMPAIKGDPPSPLQSAQCRIKRAVLYLQEIICGPLNVLDDLAAVPRTIKKRSKNKGSLGEG
jgi:hypothetical protein